MAPRRSVPDDRRQEALAVAGCRPGWGRVRRLGSQHAHAQRGPAGRAPPVLARRPVALLLRTRQFGRIEEGTEAMIDRQVEETVGFLRANGFDGCYDCAMVLGTGLGTLAEDLKEAVDLPYADIPHFPRSSVSGHSGRLIAGRLERKRVLILQGRVHYYETGDAAAMRVPITVVKALGGPPLVLTNAAGSTTLDIR